MVRGNSPGVVSAVPLSTGVAKGAVHITRLGVPLLAGVPEPAKGARTCCSWNGLAADVMAVNTAGDSADGSATERLNKA